MFKSHTKSLIIIIALGAVLRFWYVFENPLTGDEVGVSLLVASGQSAEYEKLMGPGQLVSSDRLKKLIAYTKGFYTKDVLHSLENDGDLHNPPFYYLFLRAVMFFFGNDIYVLRSVSILISLLCVHLIFLIGKNLWNDSAGISAALILSLSPYGVAYGSFLRPYTPVMLISLLTTYQVIRFIQNPQFRLADRKTIVYILAVTLGLYMLYHFAFVVAVQAAILIAANLKNRKNIINVSAAMVIIGILFIPALPCLFKQLGTMSNHGLYFYGHNRGGIFYFAKYLFIFNISRIQAYMPEIALYLNYMKATFLFFIAAGVLFLFKNKVLRPVLLGFALYPVIYFICEKVLDMRTLSYGKFYFFSMPMLVLFLAAGLCGIFTTRMLRTASVAFVSGMLLLNTAVVIEDKPPLDSPYVLNGLKNYLNSKADADQRPLVIFNTAERRYVLSLIYALRPVVNVSVVRNDSDINSQLDSIGELKDYDTVYFVNYYAIYARGRFFNEMDASVIIKYFEGRGYKTEEVSFDGTDTRLYVFTRNPAVKP